MRQALTGKLKTNSLKENLICVFTKVSITLQLKQKYSGIISLQLETQTV